MLTALTVGEFAARLASSEPAPGGGSAAALSGLLGASLVAMAIVLTRGRKDFAAHETMLAAREAELGQLRADLQALVDRDAAAFSAVMAAYALPEASEADKQARAAAIQAAMEEAAEVPLLTACACLAVLEIAQAVLGAVSPHVASDLAAGALACHAGLTGALLSAAVNLPAINDQTLVRACAGRLHLLRAAGDELAAHIKDKVYSEPAFAVMRE